MGGKGKLPGNTAGKFPPRFSLKSGQSGASPDKDQRNANFMPCAGNTKLPAIGTLLATRLVKLDILSHNSAAVNTE